MTAGMRVKVLTHPSSLAHSGGLHHPESPERLAAVLEELEGEQFADIVHWEKHARSATMDELSAVHPIAFLRRIEQMSASGGGSIDSDTGGNSATWTAVCHASGAAIEAALGALDGVPSFAAVRPPGHHATRDTAMGFCFVNHVVVAAMAALARPAVDRVLIVDWDVHHGNGTQALVEHDARIRYVSLHQWPHYPGTGRVDERGVGNVFNVPRPPGLPPANYVRDLNEAVEAATTSWQPDLVLISAGFDAMAGDPLGGFTLEPEHYAEWVRQWRQLGAPMAALLEGGYAPQRIRLAAAAMVSALGENT